MAKLVDKRGNEVKLPAKVKDFRGEEWTITGFTEPRHAGSSGRVHANRGHGVQEFYPTVFNLEIVQ